MTKTSSLPPPPESPPDPAADQQAFWADPPDRSPKELRPADLRLVLLSLAVGVAFDLAIRRPATTAATTLLVVVISVGLLASKRLVTRHSRVLAALAPLFGLWAMIRVSPWLTPLNLIAAAGLLGVAIISSTERSIFSVRGLEVLAEPFVLIGNTFLVGRFLRRGLEARTGLRDREQVRAIVTGLAIMIPIVAGLGALLASGDALMGEIVGGIGFGSGVSHSLIAGIGTMVGLVVLFRAASGDDDEPSRAVPRLGTMEASIVFSGIAALYGAFAVLQIVGALGAADSLLDDPGATKDWVREGFFQLLWAAGITLSVLIALDRLTRPPDGGRTPQLHRRLRILTAALTVVIVAMSISRIVVYSDTFGLTMLRLYSVLFAGWIAVVFGLYALRSWQDSGGRWMSTASGAAGLALLLGLNIANPEAIVARYDTEFAQVDVDYVVNTLSYDAVPTLVEQVPKLEPVQSERLRDGLCAQRIPARRGWLSWNRSRAQARASLTALCEGR